MNWRTINIALSPNNTWRDTLTAYAQIVLPWNWLSWKNGRAVEILENNFAKFLTVDRAYAVGSGREALYVILKSLGLAEDDEIILQSFTCMVVVNSIKWSGLKPIFCDIEDTYNLDPAKLEKLIGPKTRAVIVQHTFGIPAKIEEIRKICLEKNLILIEDCAHAMGATVDGKKVGTIGDFGFYSLGRSKVISSVSGGMIVCNNNEYLGRIEKEYAALTDQSRLLIFQNLMHPIICSLAKATYSFGLGKLIMVLSQKLKLLSFEVTKPEKKGVKMGAFPSRMPNALAKLGIIQLRLLDKFNEHRIFLAKYYFKNLKNNIIAINPEKFPGAIFLRYPVRINKPELILKSAKKVGIILGDWYSVPVAPADIDLIKSAYIKGQNPVCESICIEVINLPTQQNISRRNADKIINFLNSNV